MRWLILLLLAGCTSEAPKHWTSVGGQKSPQQFELDRLACAAEVDKADLARHPERMPINLSEVHDNIMQGCMAQRGYVLRETQAAVR